MIVVGNASILVKLARSYRRRRSNVNYFIVHLAIADLLVGLVGVSSDVAQRLYPDFSLGLFVCVGQKYAVVLLIFSSTYLLVALTVDRWEAVVKPLTFTKHPNRGYQLVGGAWLLAAVSALPVLTFTGLQREGEARLCKIILSSRAWRVYMTYLTCFTVVLPALIIAVCYVQIVFTIWTKARVPGAREKPSRSLLGSVWRRSAKARSTALQMQPLAGCSRELPVSGETADTSPVQPNAVTLDVPSDADTEDEELSSEEVSSHEKPQAAVADTVRSVEPTSGRSRLARSTSTGLVSRQHGIGVIPKARIKTVKMTFVIVAAFILSWAPFYIFNMLKVFGVIRGDTSVSIAFSTLTQSLSHLNSFSNPIVYWLFNGTDGCSNTNRRTNSSSRITAGSLVRTLRSALPLSRAPTLN